MIARLKALGLGLLALLVALGSAWLFGRQKGKQAGEAKAAAAKVEAANAQATADHLETRHEIDVAVARLPDASVQPVGAAEPASAAGQLQGWTRD